MPNFVQTVYSILYSCFFAFFSSTVTSGDRLRGHFFVLLCQKVQDYVRKGLETWVYKELGGWRDRDRLMCVS